MSPLPPSELQVIVGSVTPENFEAVGCGMSQFLKEQYHRAAGPDPPRNMLDFGCGCGRLTKWWPDRFPGVFVHATDMDPRMVEWCTENLSGSFLVARNTPEPPLPMWADGTVGPGVPAQFDLAVATSVFTHMTMGRARAWMREMSRVLRVGGVGLFTYLGPHFWRLHKYTAEQTAFLTKAGSFYTPTPTDLIPNFGDVLYMTEAVARAEFGRVFDVVEVVCDEGGSGQDLIVVKKRER